jgi:hypothetical protein
MVDVGVATGANDGVGPVVGSGRLDGRAGVPLGGTLVPASGARFAPVGSVFVACWVGLADSAAAASVMTGVSDAVLLGAQEAAHPMRTIVTNAAAKPRVWQLRDTTTKE